MTLANKPENLWEQCDRLEAEIGNSPEDVFKNWARSRVLELQTQGMQDDDIDRRMDSEIPLLFKYLAAHILAKEETGQLIGPDKLN